MANRPRRSKTSDSTASKTIDLTAGTTPAAAETPAGKTPDGNPPVGGVPGADRPAGDRLASERLASDGPASVAPTPSTPTVPPASSADGRAGPVPGTPVPPNEASRATEPGDEAKAGEPAVTSAPSEAATPEVETTTGSAVAPSGDTPSTRLTPGKSAQGAPSTPDRPGGAGVSETKGDSAVEAFAAEEGFTRPMSEADLAEFEDDDTALAAAEPSAATAAEAAPYREPEIHPAPPTTGSLVGAAVGGALLALVGGGVLLYSGVLPGLPVAQPAATQYASAGEVQRLSGDISTVREAVEQIQSAQAAGGATTSPVSSTDFAALSDRVAAAERTLQSGSTASGDLASGLDEVRTAIDGVRQAAEGARETAAGAVTAANSANEAATAAGARADEAGQQVAAIGGRMDTIEAANRNAAIALSAASLKAAIDRGGAFMPELEAYAQSSGGGAAVDALRDSAARGVPTLAQLQAEWPELERRLLLAVRPETANAPVGDQLMAGLRSLVTVRPDGAASATAEGPEGAVARMDSSLRQGNLGAFLAERDSLPEAARNASADFAAQVQARHTAGELVDGALTRALTTTKTTD